jgi:hypothetical protein
MTINIKAKDKVSLYRNYIHFLHPVMKVTPQETDVLAVLMMKYNEIGEEVKNTEFINKLLFNSDTRNTITDLIDISKIRYDQILLKFRGMGIVKGTGSARVLSDKIIPTVKDKQITVNVIIHEK